MKLFFEWIAEAFKVLHLWMRTKYTLEEDKKKRLEGLMEELEDAKTQKQLESVFNRANSI